MKLSEEALRRAFNFTEEDLMANGSGCLTEKQKDMLKSYRKQQGCGFRWAVIAISVSLLIMFFVFLSGSSRDPAGFQQSLPYFIGFLGFAAALFGFFLALGRYRSRHVRSATVTAAEGRPRIWTREYRTGTGYFAEAGGVRFRLLTREQMEVLNEDRYYRIHFVRNPPVHVILSLQAIG